MGNIKNLKKENFIQSGVKPGKLNLVTKQKIIRKRGGDKKTVLLSTNVANVLNPETKKTQKTNIKNVLETPSNRFLARQNILVKSAIIETELGKAKITNRPSQEGSVQAVLLKKENSD